MTQSLTRKQYHSKFSISDIVIDFILKVLKDDNVKIKTLRKHKHNTVYYKAVPINCNGTTRFLVGFNNDMRKSIDSLSIVNGGLHELIQQNDRWIAMFINGRIYEISRY